MTDAINDRITIAILKESCKGRIFTDPIRLPPSAKTKEAEDVEEAEEVEDVPVDAYRAFDSADPDSDDDVLGDALDQEWSNMGAELTYDPEFALDFGQECQTDHMGDTMPTESRMTSVKAPAVVARGSPPVNFTCWNCGKHPGAQVQLPVDVFGVAYRTQGELAAMECLVAMAKMLATKQYNEVLTRTTCCSTVRCMLSQGRLCPENYRAWVCAGTATGTYRAQLERGTERKDQGLVFSENVILIRMMAVQKPQILSEAELSALFEFVVLNSQFIQEREKRFIATALAAVDNEKAFMYKFSNARKLVAEMAKLPRDYASIVIFGHVMDMTLTAEKWKSKGNRLFETAYPKAYDALFAFLCVDNAAHQGNPTNSDGRIIHRVPVGASYASIFTHAGFRDALARAVKASPKYILKFAHENDTSNNSRGGLGTKTQRDTVGLLRLLSGSQKRTYAVANGAVGKPTCGSLQSDSGVHTFERYMAVFKASGFTDAEAKAKVEIFVVMHESGNKVGFEKLHGKSVDTTKSKACATIRKVLEFTPPKIEIRNKTRHEKTFSNAYGKRTKVGH